jgi:hypothetical protein
VQPVQFQPTKYHVTRSKKDNAGNFRKQTQAVVRFGPAIRIIVVFIVLPVIVHAQPALQTLTPVHQGALKVGRYIGLICNGRHGNPWMQLPFENPSQTRLFHVTGGQKWPQDARVRTSITRRFGPQIFFWK